MSMVKSVTAVGGRNIPGAVLVYTITYHNGGTGSAASIVISDNIPDKTTYVANSVKLNTVAKTDATDADEVIVGSGTIVVNVGNVGPGASGTIEFRTTIN
jgi:uncharacterized repeat protein (TIGR01451 family)